MMKPIFFILSLLFICIHSPSFGQTTEKEFHGAQADLASYHALYVLNHSDEKSIRGIIRNINNALDDPRLKGKLEVELIAFGDGVEMYKKDSQYESLLLELKKRNVLLTQCENTIKERKISKEELYPFIDYVPSANGEMIIRQGQHWAIIHP